MTKLLEQAIEKVRALPDADQDHAAELLLALAERARLKTAIDEAWDDPRPSVPAREAFDRIEAMHAETAGPKKSRA